MGIAGPLLAAGTGLNVYGQMESAKASAAAAGYNTGMDINNSEIALQEAKLATQEGDQKVERSQLQTRSAIGGIEARQGASGVEVGTGSSRDVVQSAREIGMLDAMTIRSDAVRKAYGYKVQSQDYQNRAALDKAAGKAAGKAGAIGVGSTILGAVSGGAESGAFGKYTSSKSMFSGDSFSSAAPSDSAVLAGIG